MKLKNIYIRDFGIFNNQYLKDLADGLVVIGGHNRSGKSSFLNIIKNLPYGLPQDGSIPPPREEYYIETELSNNDKNYNLILEGFAKTKVNSINNNNDLTAAQLFNNLDKLSYQQLFTISLDELQHVSKITKNNKKQKKIFSLLLGAGLSELIKVPEIADNYFNDSVKIGGKLGSTNVSQFKSYYKLIKEAEKEKNRALKQLDDFIAKREELTQKEENLKLLEEKIEDLKKEEFLFDLLKNNYQNYKEIEELKFSLNQLSIKDLDSDKFSKENYEQAISLKESYQKLKKNYQTENNTLSSLCTKNNKDKFLEIITAKSAQINKYNSKQEVIKEKISSYLETKNELNEKINMLENELKEINSDWNNPLQEIKNIKTDKLKQKDLSRTIENFNNIKQRLENLRKDKENLKEKQETYLAELKQFGNFNPKSVLKNTYVFGVLSFVLAISAAFYNFSTALITLLSALFLTHIYFSTKYKPLLEKEKEKEELEIEIKTTEKKLNNLDSKIKQLEQNLKNHENSLNRYRAELGINDSKAVNIISDYYRIIQDKKSRLELLNKDQEKLKEKRRELEISLKEIITITAEIYQYTANKLLKLKENNLVAKHQEIFVEFKIIIKYLEIVNRFKDIEEKYLRLEAEIETFLKNHKINFESDLLFTLDKYLNKAEKFSKFQELEQKYLSKKEQLSYGFNSSDRIRNYLLNYFAKKEEKNNETGVLASFEKLYKSFSSLQAVEKAYRETSAELTENKKDKKLLVEEINTLKNEIKKLASSQDVQKAHQKINYARSDLRNLAERYAVNKSVYFILNKLRERVINKAEDELLKPAAAIMAEITADEYSSIETSGDIEDTEFKTVLADGSSFSSVDYLSRGTMEQLFLAVRLSRIKEIKPHLPVVLDDSLVNFDHSHLINTIKVISRLAKTHQVFVLTCHSHLIKCLKNISQSAQYWKLENGNFEQSNADSLQSHLLLR